MTIDELKDLASNQKSNDADEEYSIPICLDDIISICKNFNQLGWQIRQQVENLLEVGIEEAITSGYVKRESLPLIKDFLQQVSNNPYFGDAVDQAQSCIRLIQQYEDRHSIVYSSSN